MRERSFLNRLLYNDVMTDYFMIWLCPHCGQRFVGAWEKKDHLCCKCGNRGALESRIVRQKLYEPKRFTFGSLLTIEREYITKENEEIAYSEPINFGPGLPSMESPGPMLFAIFWAAIVAAVYFFIL